MDEGARNSKKRKSLLSFIYSVPLSLGGEIIPSLQTRIP
jgi:hypothetical protein